MSRTSALWNKDKALARMMGKHALLEKVTAMFLLQFPELWNSAKSDLEHRNWAEVKAKAHTLKGSAAELGLDALADALFSLEQASSVKNDARAMEAKKQIDEISHQTLALLNT